MKVQLFDEARGYVTNGERGRVAIISPTLAGFLVRGWNDSADYCNNEEPTTTTADTFGLAVEIAEKFVKGTNQ